MCSCYDAAAAHEPRALQACVIVETGMARKKSPPTPSKRARKPANKGKTSSKPGESAKAHEFLMGTLEEGKGEDDPFGDKAWLAQEREEKIQPREIKEGRVRPAEETAPKIGRPTGYKPEFVKQAEKLCRLGATDREIADFFEVDRETIRRWSMKHEEFCGALKAGKEIADERVERSLYQRAVGYSHDAVKIFMPAGAENPVYAPYVEHVQPDTTACIFWLKNRRPEQWRDKREIEVNSEGIAALLDEARERESTLQARRAH